MKGIGQDLRLSSWIKKISSQNPGINALTAGVWADVGTRVGGGFSLIRTWSLDSRRGTAASYVPQKNSDIVATAPLDSCRTEGHQDIV